MNQKTGVYAGSFDPPTVGHVWMIEQGARLFDSLLVAIGVNPDKRPTFSLEERLEMLRELTQDLTNVVVASFTNQYLVRYAEETGASYILRGIRSESDFDFERVMRQINADLAPGVTTVFLVPPREIAEVSSSMVRGLIGPEGWEAVVARFVPPTVFAKIKERYGHVKP